MTAQDDPGDGERDTGADRGGGWRPPETNRPIRVLLLLESRGNRAALEAWAPPWFDLIEGSADSIPGTFDLCIVDEGSFARAGETLQRRKEEAEPTFLPVLLVATSPDAADSEVWRRVDDVIQSPIRKRELQGRIEVLLRARETSVQLRRQRDRLDQFASVLAHDLRNPLGVATGYLQLARERGDEDAFARVDSALARMEDLIDDVLALARKGEESLQPEPTRLAACVDAAWADVASGDATLRNDVDPGYVVLADESQLMELLENLFRNAVEHGSRDDADDGVTVQVGTLQADGFFVADDGPGVPADQRETVFEFGYTTASGTGFGLAIVEQIATAHGWTVALTESDVGGARFEIGDVEGVEE
ncbi:MAG: sensor histidine kinase [Haloferacaceae archaeon]